LLKRFDTLTVIVAVLLVPVLAFSAEKFAPSSAVAGSDNTMTVPLEIANEDGLMAVDVALKFSEGVTLKAVTFENTRVADFDLKVANINNDDHIVIIGLVHQLSATPKPTLAAGTGPIANLVFTVDDPSVREIRIDPVVTEKPHHSLMFIYNRRSNPGQVAFDDVQPEFAGVSVALSGGAQAAGMPKSFSLAQNYPNPFNPNTEISFALPVASRVELTVYNVLGQTVTTLVDGDMPAGEHIVSWNASSVSSGVYFYRLSTNGFVETKKMMLLK
jgi:hypothetical protein